mgnify:FL=1
MNFHRKLAAAITGVLFLSPLLSSCSHNTDPHAVKINDAGDVSHLIETPSQNATGWKAAATWFAIHNSASPVVSTPGGPIVLFDPSRTQKTSSSSGETATGTLVALHSEDGSVRWARAVEPGFPEEYFREPNDIEDDMPQTIFEKALGGRRKFVAASPNGRYLAVRLLPYMTSKNPHSFGDQHTHITVLDTETGNEVRTVEVTGIVLGHALTNDSLAVETAENFYPADTGKIDIFSLTNPQEKPTTTHTNRWLTGTTKNSLLLSQQNTDENYYSYEQLYTLTTLSITGEEEDTITGVTAIHPGGWIERFKDPEAAATIFQTTQGETQRKKELDALPRDLINLETGTTFDITGLSTTEVILPTGPGILMRTATTTEKDGKESTTYTATSWLPATPDATELRTDDMQHIKGEVASEPIHMGDKVI